jgi:hypothetical protein
MYVAPFLFLVLLAWNGEHRGVEWWWLAGAYLVSWFSNTAQSYMAVENRWITSAVYPIVQATLVAAVFLPRPRAERFLATLAVVASGAILAFGLARSTILLRIVAWGGIVWFVWPLPLGRLRIALVTTFGGALLGWLVFMYAPGDPWQYPNGSPTWWTYQAMWALGIVLFCWASWKPQPMLRVIA